MCGGGHESAVRRGLGRITLAPKMEKASRPFAGLFGRRHATCRRSAMADRISAMAAAAMNLGKRAADTVDASADRIGYISHTRRVLLGSCTAARPAMVATVAGSNRQLATAPLNN